MHRRTSRFHSSKFVRPNVRKEEAELHREERTGHVKDYENKMTRGKISDSKKMSATRGYDIYEKNHGLTTRGGILGGHERHGGGERGVAYGGHTFGIGKEGIVGKYGGFAKRKHGSII